MKSFLFIFSFLFVFFVGAEEPAPVQTRPAEEPAQTADVSQNSETAPVSDTQPQPAAAAEAEAPKETPAAVAPAGSPEVPAEQQPAASDAAAKQEEKPVKNGGEASAEQGYDLKLRALEEKINSLKDKIFRSKQRLAVLQETALNGVVAGTSVSIFHKNTVGSLFRLVSAVFYLDDKQVFERTDDPENLETPELKVYEGQVTPGSHVVSVFYVVEGKGYGIFSYLKTYSFKLNEERHFSVENGGMVKVTVSVADKGSEYNFNNRVYVAFDVNKTNSFDSEKEENDGAANVADKGPIVPANADSAVVITQKNTVGSMFKQISATYSLDNVPVYKQTDSPEIFEASEVTVYEGAIMSGSHTVSAECVFKGNGYGFFTYLRDYTFKVSGNYSFDADKGVKVDVAALLSDKGGSYSVDHRLDISFTTDQKTLNGRETAEVAGKTTQEE